MVFIPFLCKLEALECLSSSVGVTGDSNRRSLPDNVDSGCLHEMLSALLNETSSNWLSLDVALQIDSHMRSDLSMHYMSKMLKRHPSWVDNDMTCLQEQMCTVSENQEYKLLIEAFQDELMTTIASFQLKFSLIPLHLIYSVSTYPWNKCYVCSFCFARTDCQIFSFLPLYRSSCRFATVVWRI